MPNAPNADGLYFSLKVGTYVYSMPAGEADTHWEGLNRTHAAGLIPNKPRTEPASAPCLDKSKLCSVFLPSVPTSDPEAVSHYFHTGLGFDHMHVRELPV